MAHIERCSRSFFEFHRVKHIKYTDTNILLMYISIPAIRRDCEWYCLLDFLVKMFLFSIHKLLVFLWFVCWIHLFVLIQHFLYSHVLINFVHFCWSILCVFSLFQTETSQILFGGATWIPALADDALELSGDGQLQLGLWYLGGFSNQQTHGKGNKSPKNFETLRKISFENLGRISKTRDEN